jgi:hypothetical protein
MWILFGQWEEMPMDDDRPVMRKTRELLLDWVNLPDSFSDFWLNEMLTKHPATFQRFANDRLLLRRVLVSVRYWLRLAWTAKDMRSRDWWLFTARQQYSNDSFKALPKQYVDVMRVFARSAEGAPVEEVLGRFVTGVPPASAFDRAVQYAERMSCCDGRKEECEEPFFLRGPKRERYCATCKRKARLRSKKKYRDKKE